ncbi:MULTISPECIES: Jag family protein [Fusobacterium]|jgi:spoIIIJ-associated protein|uniref:RNA-binding protein KhpB n=1 Tax=Fusobacterium mortiferum ATCC 9817 TaxID=469616 RepID=A0ABM6TTM4_FUSMR|nr:MULTISPECIES: R3H domain-containing nucleic acid-binding protein [Fusobacterium]AVQ18074.1 KH domain-containing protein [Fusobacterium mortiferum ATCC 9817]EEO36872.1 R3H domain protein [Fusobacterium mortiferum ATCC 9817]MCF2627720.1 KH domain-containing protein [Fusobacterium mortiferum]MCF2700045.1 KH domain-containing protein [Fusobacterium mortiferum]MCI7666565.1 KH domain-containing protein [Fusobacterium mortiferum]
MKNVIEIKAMSQEQAITRALKIMEATPEQVVNVIEKQKSKSFLGIFNREGVYEIEIDKTPKEKKESKIEKIKDIEVTEKKKEHVKEQTIDIKEVKKDKKDISETIQKKAEELLENIGLVLKVEVDRLSDRNYLVNLYGEDNGIIIGKKGKTLNSFEYLLNSIMKDYRIEVDVEGFKAKRTETLRELGKKMAEKALKSGKPVRLNPMPPRERKIIHEVVNKYQELDTYSEGRDPKRYIVIKRKK